MMEQNKDIEKAYLFNVKQVMLMLAFVIGVAVSGTLIYSRFLIMEKEIQILSDRVEYVNERLTRKIE